MARKKSFRRGGRGGMGLAALAKNFATGAGTTALTGNSTAALLLNFFVLKTGVAGLAGAAAGGMAARTIRPMTGQLPDPVGQALSGATGSSGGTMFY